MTSYQTVLRQLYKVNTFHPVKLGLENMHEINRMLGYPLKGKRIVHIAGTNGKGSVSVKLASAFEAVGLRTGLFTSPHISSFRERIQVNKDTLSEDDVTVSILCYSVRWPP
jgi:dihydrofolate synthase/folylpolyglutamate synthase